MLPSRGAGCSVEGKPGGCRGADISGMGNTGAQSPSGRAPAVVWCRCPGELWCGTRGLIASAKRAGFGSGCCGWAAWHSIVLLWLSHQCNSSESSLGCLKQMAASLRVGKEKLWLGDGLWVFSWLSHIATQQLLRIPLAWGDPVLCHVRGCSRTFAGLALAVASR